MIRILIFIRNNLINMKLIELTQGKQATVDDDDYERLSKYKWCFNLKRHGKGYAQRNEHVKIEYKKYKTKTIYMHREILNTDQEVDHKNGNTLDNRKENLRPANRTQQSQNTSSRKNSSSKYVGVHIHKLTGKWRSQIKVGDKIKSLGLFPTQEEAFNARIKYVEENDLQWFKR